MSVDIIGHLNLFSVVLLSSPVGDGRAVKLLDSTLSVCGDEDFVVLCEGNSSQLVVKLSTMLSIHLEDWWLLEVSQVPESQILVCCHRYKNLVVLKNDKTVDRL